MVVEIRCCYAKMELDEPQIKITVAWNISINWYLDLNAGNNMKLPFEKIASDQVKAKFEAMSYGLTTLEETFSKPHTGAIFRITPAKNAMLLNL